MCLELLAGLRRLHTIIQTAVEQQQLLGVELRQARQFRRCPAAGRDLPALLKQLLHQCQAQAAAGAGDPHFTRDGFAHVTALSSCRVGKFLNAFNARWRLLLRSTIGCG
ncbi:hypothetical protein D3C76_1160960 [compost metagenome]